MATGQRLQAAADVLRRSLDERGFLEHVVEMQVEQGDAWVDNTPESVGRVHKRITPELTTAAIKIKQTKKPHPKSSIHHVHHRQSNLHIYQTPLGLPGVEIGSLGYVITFTKCF